ncbi:EAL domain-containing protein [Bremerella cremea]|uniref:EAL domain-containing protein n=1 Tax=Bremerella cremea TaxID=1031537 RepID=A0A368KV20_9BACT|nr:EAL domain-containing protein [Bremerella cremea]RCS54209.1 EAL domain-containing protein [Bremerella cremea]
MSLSNSLLLVPPHRPVAIPSDGYLTRFHHSKNNANCEWDLQDLDSSRDVTLLDDRQAFFDAIDLARAELAEGNEFTLYCINLDRFKWVNDTLGHQIGDKVLQEVAQRILHAVSPGDIVGRLGGDEFALLRKSEEQCVSPRATAKRIIEAISSPLEIDGHSIHVGACIGISLAPIDGEDAQDLMRHADLALFQAKAEGRNVIRFFEPEMRTRVDAQRELAEELDQAIERKEFYLCYQPVLDIEANSVTSLEALVRWEHPRLGMVSPDDFIPLAEQTGQIVELGAWVLEQACRDATAPGRSYRVAVNVSPVQLRNRKFVSTVFCVLEETGLPPERLELEITESALIEDAQLALAILRELRDCGVRIALDDFGTGYSSITYLRKFPFDKIKIDRSLVTGAHENFESIALVRMIAALGNALEVSTTAEGVESACELDLVREAGCSHIQGYYLSKPVPLANLVSLFNV